MPLVALLLGKPPQRSPVVPEVIAALRAHDAQVRVHVARRGESLPGWLTEADIVALRGLRRQPLVEIAGWEAKGLRCCNTARSTLLTKSRGAVHRRLSEAGVPVPAATTVTEADQARQAASDGPVAVKVDDTDSPGAGVVLWEHPDVDEAPGAPGPYLVQEWVPGDGVDRKLYVVGPSVRGLLKPSPHEGRRGRRPGTAFEPDQRLRQIAAETGRALGLSIYGVDVVSGPAGPMVVDVNPFPSCDGVPGAAEAIARMLLAPAEDQT